MGRDPESIDERLIARLVDDDIELGELLRGRPRRACIRVELAHDGRLAAWPVPCSGEHDLLAARRDAARLRRLRAAAPGPSPRVASRS